MILIIAFLTALNTRGLRTGKAIQNTFTFTKTAALIALIVVGIWLRVEPRAAAWTSSWWSPSANGWTVEGAQKDLGGLGTLAFVLLLGKAMIGPLFSQTGVEQRDLHRRRDPRSGPDLAEGAGDRLRRRSSASTCWRTSPTW